MSVVGEMHYLTIGDSTYSIPSSSGGSSVSITRSLTSGTKSATITVDGTDYDIYSVTADDKTWNGVTLNKGNAYANNGDIYIPYLDTYNGTAAYTGKATSTPTQGRIAKYDASAYLYSTTPSASDNSTKVATTAYVDAAIPTVPTNISAFTNDSGYITSADVPEGASAYTGTISAVGTSASAGSNNGFARGDHVHNITSSTITSALGYTPYDSTNPNGYITSSQVPEEVFNVTATYNNGWTLDKTFEQIDAAYKAGKEIVISTDRASLSNGTIYHLHAYVDDGIYFFSSGDSELQVTSSSVTEHTYLVTSITTTAGAHTAISYDSGYVSFNVPTKTSHLTNDSGFITSYTDEKLKWTASTSSNTYYPLQSTSTATTSTANTLNGISFYQYYNTAGGYRRLDLGNSTAYKSTGGAYGTIRLYGAAATYYGDLVPGVLGTTSGDGHISANRTWTLPDKTGTIALTSDIPDVSSFITDAGVTKITTTAGTHTAITNSTGAVSFNVPTKTSHLTNDSGFITTDTKVSTAAATSGTTYYPVIGTDTTSAETKYYDKAGFVYYTINGIAGDASATGQGVITLGNSTSFSSASGKRGILRLYGINTYYTNLVADVSSSIKTITLPNTTGTVALTSDIPTKVSDLTNDSGFITTDTNTTYALSGALSSHKFTSTLTAGGSGSGTSTATMEFVAGTGITLTDDTTNKKITIASSLTVPTITLNGSSTTSPSFYAPTSAGTNGYVLTSSGSGAPSWTSGELTDTKNTAGSTASTSDLYLIGATSQAANPQTYSNKNLTFKIIDSFATLVLGSGSYDQNHRAGAIAFYNNAESPKSTTIKNGSISADITLTLPNTTGTIALTSDIPNITTSTSAPTSSDGSNGDIWIVYTT